MNEPEFQRNTRQRQVILEELRRVDSHPTAAQLHHAVRQRLPRISLGTVYRNLDLLSRQGAILKLPVCRGEARFDGNTAPHYHARCVRCGRIQDVPLEDVQAPRWDGAMDGFLILDWHLEFSGLCAACRRVAEDEAHRAEDAEPTAQRTAGSGQRRADSARHRHSGQRVAGNAQRAPDSTQRTADSRQLTADNAQPTEHT